MKNDIQNTNPPIWFRAIAYIGIVVILLFLADQVICAEMPVKCGSDIDNKSERLECVIYEIRN